jgi:hypothetical protein
MALAGCGSCRCTGCAYCIREWFTDEACDCPNPDHEFGCACCGCEGCGDCAEYSFEACGCETYVPSGPSMPQEGA